LAPQAEGWRVWLMMAGRGFGKTRAGAEWIHRLAMTGGKRIALVGATIDEARAIMVEGVSGLLSIAGHKRVKVKWEPGARRLIWPRGSVAELFSGESRDGLRGPEHDFAWCDELIDLLVAGSVEPAATTAPPPSPAIGTLYRIAANGASGAFAGEEGKLAGWTEGGWRFVAPVEGMRLTERGSGLELAFRNGAWASGSLRASEVVIGGQTVVGARQLSVADPAGGTVIDAQGRLAVTQILAVLRAHGLIES
jgi:hypothetical protein